MDDTKKRNIMFESFGSSASTSLDDFFAYTQPSGSIAQAGANTLTGINQFKIGSHVPVTKDSQGFVFFTRPMLNMNRWNLMRHTAFHSLLSETANSVQRYVRCTLDPSLNYASTTKTESPLVDNNMAFIPLLSNTLITLSGWPDIVAPTFTSKEGVRKEQWSIIDGTVDMLQSFDIDATFKNIADDPGMMLFSKWIKYATAVFEGSMRPYQAAEVGNYIDYTTRIYRLVMDAEGKYVKKIACTIASYPLNDPVGKFFDYNRNVLYTEQTKEYSIRFRCMGAVYNEEIICHWFNMAAGYANRELANVVNSNFAPDTTHSYEKIPRELLSRLRYRGYPLINTNTYELEWWISKHSPDYKRVLTGVGGLTPASDQFGNNVQ